MHNSSFILLYKFCICEAAEAYETGNSDYDCLAYLHVSVKDDKNEANLKVFLHRKFHVEVEAVTHCSNSHSTIISHFRVACYMCHFIYVLEPYKANATYLVSPDFTMTTA